MQNDSTLNTIDIQRILALSPVVDEYALGDDFVIGEVSGQRAGQNHALVEMLSHPVRFDGFVLFFLRKGHVTVHFNLNTIALRERSLLVNVPGNIMQISGFNPDRVRDTELIFVLISKPFMTSIRFDFNKVFHDAMRLLDNPCITLDDEQLGIAEDYFSLARRIIQSQQKNKREIIGALLTSLTYMTASLWTNQLSEAQQHSTTGASSSRVNQVFDHFLALVNEYHTSQRGMAFYARELCLTPKYLSKLIKQASGRSAPEWIDEFVILEAKNLLKYSDKSIKEIVFQLHFPNQSVFYKFFKAHTGMTPSEYRKS